MFFAASFAWAFSFFVACGDDSSSFSPVAKLPTEVKDLKELEKHECDMGVIGEKVFVESEDLLYECDGDAWFSAKSSLTPVEDPESSSGSNSVVDPATVVVGTMTDSRDEQVYKTVKIGT